LATIVGVSRPRTSGSVWTKKGKKAYRGKRRHWYLYFYDEKGKFRKRQISAVEVPFYGSQIRRRKTYICPACGKKFRSINSKCPTCGVKAVKAKRSRAVAVTPISSISAEARQTTGGG
jgi:DNA-directed RNA polymerase subunit RPC12/RpoP